MTTMLKPTTATAVLNNKEEVKGRFLKVSKVEVTENTADGRKVSYVREILERGDAAAVVIRDPKNESLVFTRQFRVGSAVKGEREYVLDVVAGIIDPGADAKETVVREAAEEVGAENLKNIIQVAPMFYPSIGGCSEQMTVFYAEADLSNLPKFKGELSENEYIEVITIPTKTALENMHLFPTSASMVGLMWLSMQFDKDGNVKSDSQITA